MIDTSLAFSRPLASAAKLADFAADAHRFTDKIILLTGDDEILRLGNGVFCFLNALRLLVRTVSNVEVFVPQSLGGLRADAEQLVRTIEFGNAVRFLDEAPAVSNYDAILNVGWQVFPNLPSTTINANGWIARVSSKGIPLSKDCGQTNPIAALGAACLGISDVFKRLICLRENRADVFDGLEFSLYTYDTEEVSPGLPLPEQFALPSTLIAGCGAIGNGIVLLLSQLNPVGDIWLLDRQAFGDENLGTCVMLGPSGIGKSKAEFLAQTLANSTKLDPVPLVGYIESLKGEFGTETPYPELVLSGFDNVIARHQLQDLWPDMVVDGGISEFGVQVLSHGWGASQQCLKCHFVPPKASDHTQIASDATGLSRARITDVDALITEKDVELAPPEKRPWLLERIGKKTCSVVSEATMQALSDVDNGKGFSPSVPFVACMSAALVVARAVAAQMEPGRVMSPFFTFDMLQGPANGFALNEPAKATCECVRRAVLINRWKAERSGIGIS